MKTHPGLIIGIAALLIVLSVEHVKAAKADSETYSENQAALDFNEENHLVLMCEEEKLARDVYITLGSKFPEEKYSDKSMTQKSGTNVQWPL